MVRCGVLWIDLRNRRKNFHGAGEPFCFAVDITELHECLNKIWSPGYRFLKGNNGFREHAFMPVATPIP